MVPDLELLSIEIETIWATDQRGRIRGPDLVVASTAAGLTAAVGTRVPDALAAELLAAVGRTRPSAALAEPPAVLEDCRRLLQAELGPASGPSYLIPDTVAGPRRAGLVRADAGDLAGLRQANPGTWGDAEWDRLLDGQLGPWVMALHADGRVVSICHTPASSEQGAEAGVWTRPEVRGQGYAASVTAAWAALMRPTGKYLFYSTTRTNLSSQRVAARLALRPLGWLWQLTASDSLPKVGPR